jgi:hypothetical protein
VGFRDFVYFDAIEHGGMRGGQTYEVRMLEQGG